MSFPPLVRRYNGIFHPVKQIQPDVFNQPLRNLENISLVTGPILVDPSSPAPHT